MTGGDKVEAQPGSLPGRPRGGLLLGLAAALPLLATLLPTAALAQDASLAPTVAPTTAPETGAPAFPSSLAGSPLTVETSSGEEWIGQFRGGSPEDEAFATELEALLGSLGSSPEEVTVRSALAQPSEGNQVVILSLQVPGVPARSFAPQAVKVLLGDIEQPQFVLRPVGTRWVLRVVDAAVPGVYPRTVFLDGDTAWIMGGDEEYILDLLGQLPEQASAPVVDSAVLASALPVVLDGRRRMGLYEAREPLFLPGVQLRLGPAMDGWLQDLYLGEGLTPTDLVGAIAWWGVESSEESIEVEGYQVPGGSPEAVQSLLTKVFLADGQALPDEVGRTEQELGGRTVTTFDFGYSTQHVFSSGDTVWVVTDHASEPAMAEEAVAALP
jgi:hypothetical protein